MGAELRIEGEEAARLAEELATLRNMSVPEAVTGLLRQELEREREVQAHIRRMEETAAAFRATLDPPYPSSDHSWLYDENGLPA